LLQPPCCALSQIQSLPVSIFPYTQPSHNLILINKKLSHCPILINTSSQLSNLHNKQFPP
jgi:hypothetical protein